MFPSATCVKKLAGIAGQIAEAFHFVLYGMALHQIHNHCDAVTVSFVDELFQFVGGSKTARRGEKAGYVIAKAPIIGMLLDGHDLKTIVSILDDAWQNVFAEFVVRTHLFCILSHAYVAFVYQEWVTLRSEVLFLKLIRLCGVPHLGAEYLCLIILHNALAPCRYSFAFASVPVNFHFVQVEMLHGFGRKLDFPIATVGNPFQLILLVFFPSVEVAYQINGGCIRGPLAENPFPPFLVQAEIEIPVRKVGEPALAFRQFVDLVQRMPVPPFDGVCIRFEPGITLDELQRCFFRRCHVFSFYSLR